MELHLVDPGLSAVTCKKKVMFFSKITPFNEPLLRSGLSCHIIKNGILVVGEIWVA